MSSPRVFLSASLLTALQFVLSVDGKGGGRGSSYRSGSGSRPRPVVFQENGRCYDEHHVQIKCPAKNKTAMIIGIVIAVIAVIIIIVLIISFFERRSQKSKKGLEGETMKEKDGEYDYKDKSANV